MAITRIASISGLRGVVGNGLDPAVVVEFVAAYLDGRPPGPIVVGNDARVSAPVFQSAVLSAVAASGRNALVAGPAATPTIGFLVRQLGAAGGIQISASHNPPEYNGLKFFQPEGMVLSPAQGRDVLARLDRKEFHWASWDQLGAIRTLDDPDSAHLERVLSTVDVEAIRRRQFKVAVDSTHGAGGRAASSLLRSLGCTVFALGETPDGRYDHTPEPTESNLSTFARIVPAAGAAVGFAQDPDADRLALVDEKGRYIGEELTLALAVLRRLEQARGPVVMNLSTSRVAEDLARRAGCSVIRTPVGEIHVVEAMKAGEALIGGEGNGGVIDPRVGWVRDSYAGMACVLDLLAATNEPLSSLVDSLPRYSMLKDKFPLAPGASVADSLERIAQAYPDASVDRRDGLRLDWSEAWAHVRASNTEPIVRVIVEAPDHTQAARIARDLGQLVEA